MPNKEEKTFRDPFDGEYIGNIWGWKFSIMSLVLVVVMTALVVYRHFTAEISPFHQEKSEISIQQDSSTKTQPQTIE